MADIIFYMDEDLKNRNPEIGRRIYKEKVILSMMDGTEIEWAHNGGDIVCRRMFIMGREEVLPVQRFNEVSWDQVKAHLVDQFSYARGRLYIYIQMGEYI